jgi:hypothetical protein
LTILLFPGDTLPHTTWMSSLRKLSPSLSATLDALCQRSFRPRTDHFTGLPLSKDKGFVSNTLLCRISAWR